MRRLFPRPSPSLLFLLLAVAGCGGADEAPAPEAETAEIGPDAEAAIPEDAPPVTAPPGTDLWQASLEWDGEGEIRIGEPVNLTNRAQAYDNQPHFTPSGDGILYTAGDAQGRTDIHRLDPITGQARPVTRTPGESEYSPTPLPDGGFAVIRVEEDGTQRLWRFQEDGSAPSLLLPDVEPVGYQAWLDADRVALFVLGDPPALHVVRLSTGEAEQVFDGIGPSLQPVPERAAVSFVEITDGESWIREYDGETGATRRVIRTVDGGSHHAWTPDGVLLMASGRNLMALRPGRTEWEDLGPVGPAGIEWSRIAVHPEGRMVVLVGEEPAPT
jgi:hypothetical protein